MSASGPAGLPLVSPNEGIDEMSTAMAVRNPQRLAELHSGARPALSVVGYPGALRRPTSRIGGYRRHRPLWGLEALTPAELRVAQLAADGLSNPEIATALFVTRGTVECQLHAVYRKLGIGSRHDLRDELDPPIAS
jgi:DNA-binding NarL/FixJ family response regulator